ncbi:MAG: DNA-binding protein [Rikenellaceae bacterium]|nr:DNA-binding protein [Rikenellaceae bacterium]
MEVKDLLKTTSANLSLNIKFDDLIQLFKEICSQQVHPVENSRMGPSEFYNRKEVLAYLGIEGTTLWKWGKAGYIKSYPFGGRNRYSVEEVEEIKTGKRSIRYGK